VLYQLSYLTMTALSGHSTECPAKPHIVGRYERAGNSIGFCSATCTRWNAGL